jgi:hypothetical protein
MHCLRADYWEKGYTDNDFMIVVDGSGSWGTLKRVALSSRVSVGTDATR